MEQQGRPWSLQSDKVLLRALQDLSSDIMSAMQRFENGLSDLEKQTAKLSERLGVANATLQDMSQTQFIEHVRLNWTYLFR